MRSLGRAPLWCALVALAVCSVEQEEGGVISLGEEAPIGNYIPNLNKAKTAAETRAKRVRVETQARSARIRSYDNTGTSGNSLTAPAARDPWSSETTTWQDAVDNAADAGVALSKGAKAQAKAVLGKPLKTETKANARQIPITPVTVQVRQAPDLNHREASQGDFERGKRRKKIDFSFVCSTHCVWL